MCSSDLASAKSYPKYKERRTTLQKLPPLEMRVRDLAAAAERSGSSIDQRNAKKATELLDDVFMALRSHAPFNGLLQLERSGKAMLVPTESVEAAAAAAEETKKTPGTWNDKIVTDDCIDDCLPILAKVLTYY